MADATKTVQLVIAAKDAATGELKQVGDELNNVEKQTAELGKTQKGTSADSKGLGDELRGIGPAIKGLLVVEIATKAFEVFGNAVKWVGDKVRDTATNMYNMALRADEIDEVKSAFEKNIPDAVNYLSQLRKAANGTVTDFDLMLTMNKASIRGLNLDVWNWTKLLEISRSKAEALGEDTTTVFNDIAVAISTQNPKTLKALGLNVDAYNDWIAAIESTGQVLNESEQSQVLLASIMQNNSDIVMQNGYDVDQLAVAWQNVKDEVSMGVGVAFNWLAQQVFPALQTAWDTIKTTLAEWWNVHGPAIMEHINTLKIAISGEDGTGGLIGAFLGLFTPVTDANGPIGGFAETLASGLIENLASIVQSITEWLNKLKEDPTVLTNFENSLSNIAGFLGTLDEKLASFVSKYEEAKNMMSVLSQISKFTPMGLIGGALNLPGNPWNQQFGGLAGGTHIANEKGPELVTNAVGTIRHSAQQSQLMASSGGFTLNIQGDVVVDNEARMDEWVRKIEMAIGNRINLEGRGI